MTSVKMNDRIIQIILTHYLEFKCIKYAMFLYTDKVISMQVPKIKHNLSNQNTYEFSLD